LHVTQPAGYEPLVSNAYATLVTGVDEPNTVVVRTLRADDPALSLLGVEAVFESGKPPAPPRESPRPAAWVARCVWPGAALQARAPDFPRDACITRGSATERDRPVPAGEATVLEARSGWLLARADGPGWLVTTQPWYPGWSARVDDAPAAVEAVDGALVGLPLPPGSHTVTLSYRPAWLEAGGAISLVSMLVLLGGLVWERRREERHRHLQQSPS
jgi:hypothetical protein